jgi:hypothetical protein
MRKGAASMFVAHSFAAEAPKHDPEAGAMMRSMEAAELPACRDDRGKNDVAGLVEADTMVPRNRRYNVVSNITCDY